ncbi:MAG: DEAD/DEAH box helicase [Chitinophagaceae bacterium]|nr:DEAD/DEAH box helicase [Chitinophagaceae bacterium]MBP6479068.1 DEAD/DEAH box helicase [Chitinophagaceae bacterium]MBP7109838.1 DEAD/DEAH box helicase [Chitinophagaceae bacterium]MBP7316369.1 DEAD/DEAH box helicase [Chitinophagaceae bacterium]HQV55307.1 DEAD/DEAH box helicase [Chitinophagaceae bacterium]
MSLKNAAVNSILEKLNIKSLNEMQFKANAAIEKQNNILLLSATGSGKTLAFLLPLLKLIDSKKATSQALIITPSRELALQIETVFKSMGTSIKVTCCYGGHKREIEENNLIEAPGLLIGTPGRLADHIRRGNITIDTIETLVLDEFDKSLELGFKDEMSFIINALKNIKKRILTSATEALEIPDFIGMKDPVKLDFLNDADEETGLAIKTLKSDGKDKLETLFKLICMLGNRSTIVFCNHRESVERTSNLLKEKDILNVFYHGAMEQQERDAALCKFRNGTSNVLVTTDLAARGLDIANIRYIVHYHLPHTEDIFTHRNGRTARMDASGTAIIILSPEEKLPDYIDPYAEQIELPAESIIPEKPKWSTLFVAAGKKDKVNKIDIVGFLSNKGELKKEDIGLIEVKDFFSFVAVKKIKVSHTLQLIKDQKLKNKKVKIAVAK